MSDEDEIRCVSCGITITGPAFTSFPCPECGEVTIARCKNCRKQSNHYKCSECGFIGP
ncbi:MAG: Zn-ribbon RNA-binding protein with a function in translation [Candidatus Methanohalarchaeum thermophilum]|uniref:Zn-ribbon RNA-binding protein with a function in translation n=1 Tax=Methanohalarchaeum thermophilum TaxID=1903181 RepID=A0A1Q6DS20_METT1|nr:MAG: Zn-ribbon RNA-binding protein with a function in translation [Candidatus Methanohalarchaeum thermophilum]